jgi:hypothetical protein
MLLSNFTVRRLTQQEFVLAKKTWASDDFLPTEPYWLAAFEIDGQPYLAGLRSGRRKDVAEDVRQIDIQLRIPDAAFDEDSFIPEAQVAAILRAVNDKLETDGWNLP